MKSSILRTLRGNLVATTNADGLFSLSKMACIVSVFCAATAILAPAQGPSLITLYSFGGGTDGANPAFVNLVQGKDGMLYGTTQVSSGTAGTVFKIATTPSTPTTLHRFCTQGYPCPDGASPYAGLLLASNGMFYGTTTLGGKNPTNGTVFQITSAGSFKTIYNFSGTTDGSFPEAAPIQAKDGDLYGPTVHGGSSNDGILYAISTAGKLDDSLSFTGVNGLQPYGRLVQGTDGNYYGTTAQVDSGDGTVFVVKNGVIQTLHKFSGTDGGYPVGGLIQATNGTFYGTTNTAGGNTQGGTVFSITAAGKFKTLHNFCAKSRCTDGSSPLASLIQASDGNLYGTTFYGGTHYTACAAGCGTIFKISTAGTGFQILYNFCSQEECTDGSQPKGGLVQATNGTLYGTTYYGGTYNIGTVFGLSDGLAPLAKILPTLGTAGATVMILGDNLTGATRVTFNGVPAAFTVVSSTEIKATVPTGATTGTVAVVTPGGTLKSDAIFQVD